MCAVTLEKANLGTNQSMAMKMLDVDPHSHTMHVTFGHISFLAGYRGITPESLVTERRREPLLGPRTALPPGRA